MEMRLKNLSPGDRAEVIGYDTSQRSYREKLLSMGLTRGTIFTLKKVAPLGDPIEIVVRGFDLSLRKDEGEVLKIRRVP
jgi:ferrous iron transport protein A